MYKMKNKFLFIPCLTFFQCVPNSISPANEESFVKLREESSKTSKIFSCSVQPIDGDTDMSHYKISGVVLRGDVEYGSLKVAYGKRGNRLDYKIPLRPDETIALGKIYMTEKDRRKFQNGKACSFRMMFDDNKNGPQFILKNGVLEKCDKEKIDVINEEKIKISIFIEHVNTGKISKASDEIVF